MNITVSWPTALRMRIWTMSTNLARKYARIFVRGHYLFREANSFPRAARGKLWALRNRWCPRTNIRAYFSPKWRILCLLSFKCSFCNSAVLKIGECHSGLRHFQSLDVFRPIARERKCFGVLETASEASSAELAQSISYPASASGKIVLIKNIES